MKAPLINAEDVYLLYSQRSDREMANLFDLRDKFEDDRVRAASEAFRNTCGSAAVQAEPAGLKLS